MKARLVKTIVILIFLFTVLTLINTYPLIRDFSGQLIGVEGDSYQYMWDMWWVKTALIDLGQSPYQTDYLFAPSGTDLYLHSLTPLNGLISIPLQYLFSGDMVVVYNLMIVIAFVLGGLTMYFLAYDVTRNPYASFIAGYIFTFAPYHMGRALGHLGLFTMYFIPLYILVLRRLCFKPTLKNYIWLGVLFILNILISYYFGVFLLAFTIIYLVYFYFFRNLSRKVIVGVILSLVAALSLLSPILLPVAYLTSSGTYNTDRSPDDFSPDLFTYVLPGDISTYSNLVSQFVPKDVYSKVFFEQFYTNNQNYLGISVIILVLIALISLPKKRTAIWAILGFIFLIASFGTVLRIGGIYTGLPLPYTYFHKLVPLIYTPARFMTIVVVCLSVLSSLGYIVLERKYKRKIIFPIVASIVFLEFLFIPFNTVEISASNFYSDLREDKGNYAVIDLEYGYDSARAMYIETIHQKKLVGGRTSRFHEAIHHYYLTESPVAPMFYGNLFLYYGEGEIINILAKGNLKYAEFLETILFNQDAYIEEDRLYDYIVANKFVSVSDFITGHDKDTYNWSNGVELLKSDDMCFPYLELAQPHSFEATFKAIDFLAYVDQKSTLMIELDGSIDKKIDLDEGWHRYWLNIPSNTTKLTLLPSTDNRIHMSDFRFFQQEITDYYERADEFLKSSNIKYIIVGNAYRRQYMPIVSRYPCIYSDNDILVFQTS